MCKELQIQMKSRGLASLSDNDLLSILFRNNKKENASKVLTGVNYDLHALAKMSVTDVSNLGVGEAEAAYVVAALELGRRRSYSEASKQSKIQSSKDAANYIRPKIADLNYEEFWILFLKRNNDIISSVKVSQGGIAGCIVDVRLVLKNALEQNATSIIFCHNHPSGNIEPSNADKKITRQLKEAAAIMEIPVIDHIIVTQTQYYSFADEGLL